jgi:quercetin dioxygenase-like cupin family protein
MSDIKQSDVSLVRSGETTVSTPEAGLTRRIGAHNEKLSVAEHRMQKGWEGARHSHPHEQLVYVISGHLNVMVGETKFEVRTGDSFTVRGGVGHQASALADSFVIDVFTPCREDYL